MYDQRYRVSQRWPQIWIALATILFVVGLLGACGRPHDEGWPEATRTTMPSIPPYPRAERSTTVYPSTDPLPERLVLVREFASDDDAAQVFAYYRDTLAATGWRAVGTTILQHDAACPIAVLYFSQQGRWHEIRLALAECRGR